MKLALALIALLPFTAHARSFTLVDQDTKETFVCTSGGGGSETCVLDVSQVCNGANVWDRATCYNSAVNSCKNAPASFGGCVKNTYKACRDANVWDSATCYNSAVNSCK